MKINSFFKLVIAVVVVELAGVVGALSMGPVEPSSWYATLAKSPLTPPGWVFGPVWTALYFLIGVSLYLVWARGWKVSRALVAKSGRAWNPWSERLWRGDWQRANIIAVFAVQLLLNILWSVIFFGWHRPDLAFFEIIALWISIIYVMANFYRVSKPAAWLLLPYLLWVNFAAYLNYTIWALN